MRRKFEQLRTALEEFVEQREHLMLVLQVANRHDVIYPLKYLDGIEQASRRDVFVTHAQECADGPGYLDGLMAACETQIDAGNRVVAAGEGETGVSPEPWDGLPSSCFDSSQRPRRRVRALVEHIRRYFPSTSQRIVLGLLPPEVHDPEGYAAILRDLAPVAGFEPWMAGVRIICRDSQADPKLAPWLAAEGVMGTLLYPIDFGSGALAQALVEDARDPSVPADDRMNAVLQIAALDHAYGRIDDALEKYGVAYRYFVATKNPAMQGISLLCGGYALERGARVPEAWERYRQALEIGISNELQPLTLNAMMALGGMHQRGQQWAEAGKYWEGASFVAKSLSNGIAQTDAMENWGVCLVALGEWEQALEIWTQAAPLAEQWQYWQRAVSIYENLIEIEKRSARDEERSAHTRDLERARRELAIHQHQNPPPQEAAQ